MLGTTTPYVVSLFCAISNCAWEASSSTTLGDHFRWARHSPHQCFFPPPLRCCLSFYLLVVLFHWVVGTSYYSSSFIITASYFSFVCKNLVFNTRRWKGGEGSMWRCHSQRWRVIGSSYNDHFYSTNVAYNLHHVGKSFSKLSHTLLSILKP